MKRTFKDYILDIINSIEETQEFTDGMTFENFILNRKTINAVIRSLEVMGEQPRKFRQKSN